MNCEDIKNLLVEYVDDELSAEGRAVVERHLAACDACAAEVRALREAAELVGSLPRAEAPRGLREYVVAEAARSAELRRRAAALRWVRAGGWLAAAATLVLVIKLLPWQTPRDVPVRPAETSADGPSRAAPPPDDEKAKAEKEQAPRFDTDSMKTRHVAATKDAGMAERKVMGVPGAKGAHDVEDSRGGSLAKKSVTRRAKGAPGAAPEALRNGHGGGAFAGTPYRATTSGAPATTYATYESDASVAEIQKAVLAAKGTVHQAPAKAAVLATVPGEGLPKLITTLKLSLRRARKARDGKRPVAPAAGIGRQNVTDSAQEAVKKFKAAKVEGRPLPVTIRIFRKP